MKHDEDDISPYLDTKCKEIAWQKFFNGTAQIIHIHSRKAAGTTFEMWIKRMLSLPDFPWNKFIKKRKIVNSNHLEWKQFIKDNKLKWNFGKKMR